MHPAFAVVRLCSVLVQLSRSQNGWKQYRVSNVIRSGFVPGEDSLGDSQEISSGPNCSFLKDKGKTKESASKRTALSLPTPSCFCSRSCPQSTPLIPTVRIACVRVAWTYPVLAAGDTQVWNPATQTNLLYNEGDTAWVLASTALVWIMIPGVG